MSISQAASKTLDGLEVTLTYNENEDEDCSCDNRDGRTAIDSVSKASENTREKISEHVDIEEEGQDAADYLDSDSSFEEFRSDLKERVEHKVNKNRSMFRDTVYVALKEHDEHWDCGLTADDYVDYIDDMIKMSIEVWVDQRLDDFCREVAKHSDGTLDAKILLASGGVAVGVFEKVVSDVISHNLRGGFKWLVENTSLQPEYFTEALMAVFRLLVGA